MISRSKREEDHRTLYSRYIRWISEIALDVNLYIDQFREDNGREDVISNSFFEEDR